ncbi:hypothetical protein [Fibrobacter sp. UWB7]|uniref:hypothetical protein n=1 Tax=Fibrobacter sp. UWB7 TaxID=1896206 RepID=UPI00091F574F|nr:hypothetical protein [Fibrobacter sp. UWB7]SHM39827.1 hypothetical protein SAMN05720467_1189 [Fibrobacter sp. UWB7]
MSEENEKVVKNNDALPDVGDIQNGPDVVQKKPGKFVLFLKSLTTPPKRLTDIDWSKKTPKNQGAWGRLPPELKADWVIWHEIRVQNIFATIAVLLEIAAVVALIYSNSFEAGKIALLVIATIAAMTITVVFRKILYKALRVFIVGLVPAAIVVGAIYMMFPKEEHDSTIIAGEVLSAVVIYGIFAFLEYKGKLSRKHPKFEMPKDPNKGLGNWFKNTMDAYDKAGITNKDLYKRH